MLSQVEIKRRIEDRYDGNLDELLEVLGITVGDIVDAFEDRVEIYLEDLNIGATEDD